MGNARLDDLLQLKMPSVIAQVVVMLRAVVTAALSWVLADLCLC